MRTAEGRLTKEPPNNRLGGRMVLNCDTRYGIVKRTIGGVMWLRFRK
jgi:hypothetical protein